jgi:hypothetical protein
MAFRIDFLDSYDRDSLKSELQRIAGLLGKATLTRTDIDAHGRVSSGLVIKRFGSLRAALQASDLRPARFMKATNDELCSMLIELWTQTIEKFGRSPYRTELKAFGFPVSGDTYVRRFGTWNKALRAAAESVSSEEGKEETTPNHEPSSMPEGRRSLSLRKRFLVFRRDRYRCHICGQSGVELEVDHVVPVVRGGSDALDNLQTLCRDCNRGKRGSLE